MSLPSFLESLPSYSTIDVVDIGANPIDGTPPYVPLLKSGLAKLVGFEPNPAALAALNQKKSSDEVYLPYAVADGRKHIFRECQAAGMSSLLMPNAHALQFFHGFPEWGKVIGQVEMQTQRLDDLHEVPRLDYLKIDIQGGELCVFQHGQNKLKDCLVIHTEVEFLPLYENQPLFSEVELFLRKLGFVFHRFAPLVSRVVKPMLVNNDPYAGLSQQVWADAVFIKDFMRLQELSNDALLKYAVILYEIYRSFDVALAALAEYDQRNGTSLCRVYAHPGANSAG